jgi:hypothetical protein
MDWIDMTQDRDQWRALVNTVLHFNSSSVIFLRLSHHLFSFLLPSESDNRHERCCH